MARPPGIEPSPYTGALAKALGVNPQTLRNHLNSAGHGPPYLDVERALRLLGTEKAFRKKVAKFRERMAADAKFQELMNGSASGGTANPDEHAPRYITEGPQRGVPRKNYAGSNGKTKGGKKKMGKRTPEMEKQKVAAFKAQHMRKLMPRLVMHLVRLKLTKNYKRGYAKTVYMLRRAGITGSLLKWNDEARAVDIFKEAGIDMSTFEHANEIPIGNGQALIPAPPTAVGPHKGNGMAQVLLGRDANGEDAGRRALESFRRAKTSLEQWRHSFFERAQRRAKTDFDDDDGMVIEALINIRRIPSGR